MCKTFLKIDCKKVSVSTTKSATKLTDQINESTVSATQQQHTTTKLMEDGGLDIIYIKCYQLTYLSLEYIDDVNYCSSESTASFTDDYRDQEHDDLAELTEMEDQNIVEVPPASSSSINTGPPGTVKVRPPKEKRDALKDHEALLKLQELCTNSDPLLIYSNMVKIGQG